MTTPRTPILARLIGIGAAGALLLAGSAQDAWAQDAWAQGAWALGAPVQGAPVQGATRLLYERTLMDAAGARCPLFKPAIRAALKVAVAQARGAALRGGVNGEAVRQVQARAGLKASATPCDSADLAVAAGRVRAAFDGYADLRQMSFPGDFSSWSADRKPWPLVAGGKVRPGPRWRLWQSAAGGAVTVGLTTGSPTTGGGGDILAAVIAWPGAERAAGARLILRDPARATDAVIDPRRRDLAGRAPPPSVTQAFLAASLGPAPASLLPPGVGGATLVTFSPEATRALAALDPREAVTLALVFPSLTGERVQSTPLDVGDFAAGRAFLAATR